MVINSHKIQIVKPKVQNGRPRYAAKEAQMKFLLVLLIATFSINTFAEYSYDELKNEVISLQKQIIQMSNTRYSLVMATGYEEGNRLLSAKDKVISNCRGEIKDINCIVIEDGMVDKVACSAICKSTK